MDHGEIDGQRLTFQTTNQNVCRALNSALPDLLRSPLGDPCPGTCFRIHFEFRCAARKDQGEGSIDHLPAGECLNNQVKPQCNGSSKGNISHLRTFCRTPTPPSRKRRYVEGSTLPTQARVVLAMRPHGSTHVTSPNRRNFSQRTLQRFAAHVAHQSTQ